MNGQGVKSQTNLRLKLLEVLEEIMPTDRWQLKNAKQIKYSTPYYVVYAEDEEYHYRIEIELVPVKDSDDEEIRGYRLLDFYYEEKEQEKKGPSNRVGGLVRRKL